MNRKIDSRPGTPGATPLQEDKTPTQEDVTFQTRPVGELADLLNEYDAPPDVQTRIARRAALVAATNVFPLSKIERNIETSMRENGGIPAWDSVEARTAVQVTDVYRKSRRRT